VSKLQAKSNITLTYINPALHHQIIGKSLDRIDIALRNYPTLARAERWYPPFDHDRCTVSVTYPLYEKDKSRRISDLSPTKPLKVLRAKDDGDGVEEIVWDQVKPGTVMRIKVFLLLSI
jgi:hypothetical protein